MHRVDRSTQVFVILGMHRSGSSLLARSLHHDEVHMGSELLGPGPGNPKGHYENINFLHLNMEILRAAGGSWMHPPTREDILRQKPAFTKKIVSVIWKAKHDAGTSSWGWKDPRTVLTIPLYWPILRELDFDVFLLPIFRDPLLVGKSLKQRNGMDISQGTRLAWEYNQRLMAFLSETGWVK